MLFLTPILRREILSPADLLLTSAPWRQAAPPDFEPANALLSDFVYQFRPWRAFTVSSLKAGHIPLWDPHNYAGAPFLANGQSAVLNPLNLVFLVLPDPVATLLCAMASLFIAGLCAYLFGRVIGLSVLGAAITGLGFGFSGFLVIWLLWPQVSVAIWLPALFLTAEAVVRRPTTSRMLLMAAVICLQFLGGHPGTSLQMLSAASLYVIWRTSMTFRKETDWRRLARRLATLSGAIVLGAAAAAVLLLPLAEYVLESAALRVRLSQSPSLWSLPRPRLLAMVALVCPYCFGSPLRGDLPLGVFLDIGNFNELNGGYVGLVCLVLAGVAIALGARRGIDLFFVILAALAFCVAHLIPPVFNLIRAVPLLGISSLQRMLLLQAFALCVLAGRGTDLLLAAPDSTARRIVKRSQKVIIAGIMAIVILAVGGLVALLTFREQALEAVKDLMVAKVGQGTFQQRTEQYPALLPLYYDRLVKLLIREGSGRIILLALTGLAITLAVRPDTRGQRSLGWMLPGVLILDLFSFGRNYNPSIPAHLEYPLHGAIEFIQRQPGLFRILAMDGGLPPNANVVYGLHDVRGYNALETEAYHRFLAATGDYPQPLRHVPTLYFSNFESRLIDLMNVKYVVSERELHHPKLRLAWEGTSRVYENLSVMPRAFLVYRTQVFREKREMERALRSLEFDPSEVVLFEGEGPTISGPADPDPAIRIDDYQPERVVIEISSRYDGVLVLADSWFKGWEATVDGVSTEILRGNLIFRAVPISAGDHQVVFQYDPVSFRLGVLVSASALLIGVSLGLAGPLLRRRYGKEL